MLNYPTLDAAIDLADFIVLHPVEVRQLRLRQEELVDEAFADEPAAVHAVVVAELAHVREILGRFDRGAATTSRRAGLAA